MGSNVPLKRRVIFYYVVMLYTLYLTISCVILFTIVLYVNITVFILYFTLFFFTILAMYCKNTNTLFLPRLFLLQLLLLLFILLCHRVFGGVSRQKRTKGLQNFICSSCVPAGIPGLDGFSNEYSIFFFFFNFTLISNNI